MDPLAPPAWLLGLIMAVGVSLFIGLLFAIQWVKRAHQWLRGNATPRVRSVRLRPRPIRAAHGRFNGSLPAGDTPKSGRNDGEDRFGGVSSTAMPRADTETIAFHFLARLVMAGHVTETQALESACGVKAGSSKAYQEARAKLKKAIEDQSKSAIMDEPHRAVSLEVD